MVGLLGCFLGAVGFAGVAGFLAAIQVLEAYRKRRRQVAVMTPRGERVSVIRWRLRRGVPPLQPFARWLLKAPAAGRATALLCRVLEERGFVTTKPALISTALGAGLLAIGASWLWTGSPVFALALIGCAVVGSLAWAKTDQEKRAAAMRDEIPDALRSMEVDFAAGLSLMQTLSQTAGEMKGPLGAEFLKAARILETGGTAREALAVFRNSQRADELSFVAVALDVQHASGGSLGPVLEAARESVQDEIELERSLRVQTAQAKLSARIVTLMPFILVALFSFASPGFLDPFFASPLGIALLAMALIMQAAGVIIVHRMLSVDGR